MMKMRYRVKVKGVKGGLADYHARLAHTRAIHMLLFELKLAQYKLSSTTTTTTKS